MAEVQINATNGSYASRQDNSWTGVRDTPTATSLNSFNLTTLPDSNSSSRQYYGLRYFFINSTNLINSRIFLYFDVSSITSAVSATLTFLPITPVSPPNFRVVKSTAFGGDGATNLTSTDYGLIDYNTAYSDEIDVSSITNLLDFTFSLNNTALTDINSNNHFTISFITFYDFDNNPDFSFGDRRIPMYFSSYLGTGYQPYLTINTAAPVFVGNISYVHFNKATLTAAEVKQNYNTLKHRFK